jgi:hypothetical protein
MRWNLILYYFSRVKKDVVVLRMCTEFRGPCRCICTCAWGIYEPWCGLLIHDCIHFMCVHNQALDARWLIAWGHGGWFVGVVIVVLQGIYLNRLYFCHLMQDLFVLCSHYVTVFNITMIFCNEKVFSVINCKGFSGNCIAVLLFPFHWNYSEMCSYAWILI